MNSLNHYHQMDLLSSIATTKFVQRLADKREQTVVVPSGATLRKRLLWFRFPILQT